mmetsp:Transcript_9766/g.22565  ORF Transcript_9766/g.22565 Transcript_9766/m.22565 type:complete len:225 (+) Transcript_9766:557-1231(+)
MCQQSGHTLLASTASNPILSAATLIQRGRPTVAAATTMARFKERASNTLKRTSHVVRRAKMMAAGSSPISPWSTALAASTVACEPISCRTTPTWADARAAMSLRPSPTKPTATGPRFFLAWRSSGTAAVGSSGAALSSDPRAAPEGKLLASRMRALSSGSSPACTSWGAMPSSSATLVAGPPLSPVSSMGVTPRPRSRDMISTDADLRPSCSTRIAATLVPTVA